MTNRGSRAAWLLGIAIAAGGCTSEVGGLDEGAETVGTTSEALSTTVHAVWYPDSTIEGTALTRPGTTTLDQLLIHSSGQPGRWHRDASGNWTFEYITGAPSGVGARAIAAAYSGTSATMHVFIHGTNGKIYRTQRNTGSSSSSWSSWQSISSSTSVKATSKVAVATRGSGLFDVFWVTNSNTIAHVKISGSTVSGPVTGSSSRPWFQPVGGAELTGMIRAIATDSTRVDVFAIAGTRIQHMWELNGSNWGTTSQPHRMAFTSTITGSSFTPLSLTVSSPGSQIIDLVTLKFSPFQMATVRYAFGQWPNTGGTNPWVIWDPITLSPSGTPVPADLFGATHFNDNGTPRVNIIGNGGNLHFFDGYAVD
ncbi:MAG: hypothetical protein DIU78_011475 [Pseudomonadota bacterium]